ATHRRRTYRPLPCTASTRPAPSSSASALRAVPRATQRRQPESGRTGRRGPSGPGVLPPARTSLSPQDCPGSATGVKGASRPTRWPPATPCPRPLHRRFGGDERKAGVREPPKIRASPGRQGVRRASEDDQCRPLTTIDTRPYQQLTGSVKTPSWRVTDESVCTPDSVTAPGEGRGGRPSISACRRRQALAAYPQARTGRPQTPAQATGWWPFLALLRVGFA